MKRYKENFKEDINLKQLTIDVKKILSDYQKLNNLENFKLLKKGISSEGFNVFNDKFNLVEIEYYSKKLNDNEKIKLLKLAVKVLEKNFKKVKLNQELNRIQIEF